MLEIIYHGSTHHSVFTGQMPFLLSNQRHQCTEGKQYYNFYEVRYFTLQTTKLGATSKMLCGIAQSLNTALVVYIW